MRTNSFLAIENFMLIFVCVAALLALAGCATPPVTVDTACEWVKPINVVKADILTAPTASQILAHNRKWQRNCPNEGASD